MIYKLDITTEMMKAYNGGAWLLADNLPAGKYKLTGTGRYFVGSAREFAYNDGQTDVYVVSMRTTYNGITDELPHIFGGSSEAILNIQEGGRIVLMPNDPWGRYANGYTVDLSYTLTPEDQAGAPGPAASLVTVHVVDSVTQNPIQHAHIVLNVNNMGETNSDGDVTIPTVQGDAVAYDVTAIGYQDIHSTTPIPNATWYIAVSMDLLSVPPVAPPSNTLPPPPVLDACVLPELSWNFIEVVRQAVTYISCNLGNLIVQVSWLVSALAALIPQLLSGIAYFLALKWITDWIQAFFDRLDIWISAKFGIDPTLPFFEELMKKAIGWLSGGIDEAARKATERLK
jgi:hypothetical protein